MESLKLDPVLIESAPEAQTASPTPPDAEDENLRSTAVASAEKNLLAALPAANPENCAADTDRKVTREQLVNRLNFINFQDDIIHAHFTHQEYERTLLVPAAPEPCLEKTLELRWLSETDVGSLLNTHLLDFILVPRGQKFIKSVPEVLAIDAKGACLALPEISREISHRKVERQCCRDISVYVLQNSSSFSGTLLDFTASSFRTELKALPPQSFDWIDPSVPVNVILFSGNQTFFSGECKIIRCTQGQNTRSYVLESLKQETPRYCKAEFRSQRQILNPSPDIIFMHPLTRKRIELKVIDLSGSGFSVEEDENSAVLLPGLILPSIELRFNNSFKLNCSVQVVFRKPSKGKMEGRRLHCGLAIIDMTALDHVKLLGLLNQAKDKNSYLCSDIDLDQLWDFFFDTGFIYPSKYALIHENKVEVRATYEKLYTRSPDIARYFVYQHDGQILGHMAMIRFWNGAWLTHHHAARKSALNRAGLVVLDQISRLVYDSYRLRSMHMDYLVCYYRPQNKFPNRIFGGVAGYINNPKGCSVDSFAFLKPTHFDHAQAELPASWEVCPLTDEDLRDLEYFYEKASGGLMLKALDLEPHKSGDDPLRAEFAAHGFRRERHLFALNKDGRLQAVLIAYLSDIGLNLSDLTHCVQALVLDPEHLPSEILLSALRQVCRVTGQKGVPALIYPLSYAEKQSIPFEKAYNLWIIHNHSQFEYYFRYLNRLLRYK
jgi:hypothetical protein